MRRRTCLAEDLVSVGYCTDWDGNTAVDRIQVEMKGRRAKYAHLIEGCKRTRNKEISVSVRRTNLFGRRVRPFYLEHLNPCDVYEVTLEVDEEQLPIFNVGPCYNGDYERVILHQEQDNEVYESYSCQPFQPRRDSQQGGPSQDHRLRILRSHHRARGPG